MMAGMGDAAAIAYMNGLLRATHTEDTREDSPAVPLDPALVRMIPVGRTGETAGARRRGIAAARTPAHDGERAVCPAE